MLLWECLQERVLTIANIYEITKHMSDKERMGYYNKRGREVQKKLEKMKAL